MLEQATSAHLHAEGHSGNTTKWQVGGNKLESHLNADGPLQALPQATHEQISSLCELVLGLGFSGYLLTIDGPQNLDDSAHFLLYSNSSWEARYREKQYAPIDPILLSARQRPGLYRWDGDRSSIAHTYGPSRVLQEAKSFGFANGISISSHLGRQGVGVLSATTSKADAPELRMDHSALDPVVKSFDAVLTAMTRWLSSQPLPLATLSARESQTIFWAAHGKSSQETAELLNLAEVTVRFHLSSVKNKLGTRNKAHSVAKAIALGLVQL